VAHPPPQALAAHRHRVGAGAAERYVARASLLVLGVPLPSAPCSRASGALSRRPRAVLPAGRSGLHLLPAKSALRVHSPNKGANNKKFYLLNTGTGARAWHSRKFFFSFHSVGYNEGWGRIRKGKDWCGFGSYFHHFYNLVL
jgi:hypothetical protein